MSSCRCKMCGGTLKIMEEQHIAVCEFCGSKQSIPNFESDTKLNQYERASILRRNNEYDKASSLYEMMLYDSPLDADLYWNLVLCKYGIEYVLDKDGKRVPTINRSQYTSIYDDENYKLAIKYANNSQKEVFEAEAKVINDIQSDILLISQNEDPFDIFICYKENDASGLRSEDSKLATNLYHKLVNEGYKVFFSRITLEDKLGSAYEPYIFAALNSAKVMLVIGTRKEHFEAVWVKNEWSRFLNLINTDNEKVLIPLYKDMDPYDLPAEFSHLQAQDMKKIGFEQDLIYGISKIINKRNESLFTSRNAMYQSTIGMITRAELLIEDNEISKAKSVIELALNTNPKDPMIYVLLLLIDYKIKYVSELVNVKEDFTKSKYYQKALRFSDETLANKLKSLANERIYLLAKEKEKVNELEEAYSLYDSIRQYKNASILASVIKKQLDEKETKEKYEKANSLILRFRQGRFPYKEGLERLEEAKNILKEIIDYQDSRKLINEVDTLISDSNKKQRRKKRLKIGFSTLVVVLVVGGFTAYKIVNDVVIPHNTYLKANALKEDGEYLAAINLYTTLGDYKDSKALIDDSFYLLASNYFNSGDYEKASNIYKNLESYGNSKSLALDCDYYLAIDKFKNSSDPYVKYEESYNELKDLNGYKDSDLLCDEITYQYAKYLYRNKEFERSLSEFNKVYGYKETASLLDKVYYDYVVHLKNSRNYVEALNKFNEFNLDKNDKLYDEICYGLGEYYYNHGDYSKAMEYLNKDENNKNSELMNEIKYDYVLRNDDKEDPKTYRYLKELKAINYLDSADIYERLYGYKIEVFAINLDVNSAYDYRTNLYGQDHIVFHFKVSGGTPSGSLDLRAKYKMSDGDDGSFYFDHQYKDGDVDWLSFSNLDTLEEGKPLEIRVSFRNRTTGKEIGSAVATINNPLIGENETVVNTKLVNGFYFGRARGYNGFIEVDVRVADGKINDVRVTSQEESAEYYKYILEMENRIIKAGSTNVDVISGATITSRAVIEAVNKALEIEE